MTESEKRPGLVPLIAIGLAAGLLSGLFGIGGGTIIVPALALWLGMPQRLAAGTSVAAILPAAAVGAISYAVQGNVDWTAALCLAVGIVAGAQLGTRRINRSRSAGRATANDDDIIVVILFAQATQVQADH